MLRLAALRPVGSKMIQNSVAITMLFSLGIPAFADGEENAPVKITAFSSLEASIAEQYLFVGDDGSKISHCWSRSIQINKRKLKHTKGNGLELEMYM